MTCAPSLRRRVILGAGALAFSALTIAAAMAIAQPVIPMQPNLGPRTSSSVSFQAWAPPGVYSSFVISSSGTSRLWPVAIVTKDARFAVTVRPGENVIIPFPTGWKIGVNDEVRIESDRVPFFDYSILDPLDGTDTFVLHAFGITANGPVPFAITPGVPDWVIRRADERVLKAQEK